jgi:hypothetical protein
MIVVDPIHILASILPHVRDPWPASIGLELPFALAGAGDVAGGALFIDAPPEERNRIAHGTAVRCFLGGSGFYLLALVNQLTLQL